MLAAKRSIAEPVIRAIGATLKSNALDPAFKAEAILLPSETLIAERMEVVDPDAIHAARETLRRAMGTALAGELACGAPQRRRRRRRPSARAPRAYGGCGRSRWGCSPAADEPQAAQLAKAQFDGADNMTDRQGALGVLVSTEAPERKAALDAFYARFHDDPLVLDKWFALQAAAQRPDTVDQVLKLAQHPDFTMSNPNRLRSLAGMFGGNHWAFHSADGRGYDFLADMIIAADKLNPQVAARMVPAFGRWRRFEPKRSAMMRQALERIVATPGLSKDVFEQASKSLA